MEPETYDFGMWCVCGRTFAHRGEFDPSEKWLVLEDGTHLWLGSAVYAGKNATKAHMEDLTEKMNLC